MHRNYLAVYVIFSIFCWFFSACSRNQEENSVQVKKGIENEVTKFKRTVYSPEGSRIIVYNKSVALLIGVSDYTNGWSDLESVPGEIELMEKSLDKQSFGVEKVLNPTSQELKDAIEHFIITYGFEKDNRLLIFFSGHGHSRKGGKKVYIVPADAADPNVNGVKFRQKAIEMEQVITWAKRIEAKHVLFLFDSCFAGTIFESRDTPVSRYISYITGRPVRQFITAGSAGERIPSRSYFVPSLIRGIEGDADADEDGYITGTELGIFIQKKLLSSPIDQTPQYGKIWDPDLDKGDFVFIPEPSSREKTDLSKYREEARKKWAAWLQNFKDSIRDAETLEMDNISIQSKIKLWETVLSDFRDNNPYSNEDENLRKYIDNKIKDWEEKLSGMDYRERIESTAKKVYKNNQGFREVELDYGIVMVCIPGGEFTRGWRYGERSERPVHSVYLDEYWIGKYEITFEQYDKFCEETGKAKPVDKWGRGKHPVIFVSWDDAQEFCRWLSQESGLDFNLPTEAQWEKAARGTDKRKFPWGNQAPNWKLANYNLIKNRTTPVGSYPRGASPYGIMDMAGNVWEWCLDWFDSNYYEKKSSRHNPQGPIKGQFRVMKGGSAWSSAFFIRCSNRNGNSPFNATRYFGFRLALTQKWEDYK